MERHSNITMNSVSWNTKPASMTALGSVNYLKYISDDQSDHSEAFSACQSSYTITRQPSPVAEVEAFRLNTILRSCHFFGHNLTVSMEQECLCRAGVLEMEACLIMWLKVRSHFVEGISKSFSHTDFAMSQFFSNANIKNVNIKITIKWK